MTDFDRLTSIATDLADEDYRRMHMLVIRRRGALLTQQDVANHIGWTLEEVKDFESYNGDPTLSEIRVYTLCVIAAERRLSDRSS